MRSDAQKTVVSRIDLKGYKPKITTNFTTTNFFDLIDEGTSDRSHKSDLIPFVKLMFKTMMSEGQA